MRSLTVILTVFNRDELTLANTLRALNIATYAHPTVDVLIVDDGSSMTYSRMRRAFPRFRWERVDSVADAGAYNIDGHNNPAYANNRALELAEGDDILWLSSDVIVPPTLFDRMGRWSLDQYVWSASVVNMSDFQTFLGANRFFPMCWCIASSRRVVDAAGGFDEEYIKGMAFEDNDFTARLALETGSLVLDTNCVTFHQSHPLVAYSDDGVGFGRSQKYTQEKWGGIPWAHGYDDPVIVNLRSLGECLVADVSRAEARAAG